MEDLNFELNLQDDQWPMTGITHDRLIARAIVFDDSGRFYFVRVNRDDDFGKAELIETSGGGVEKNESVADGLKRELKEELGVEADVLCKIGIVSDYYNLIHRHNLNHYYLCKVRSIGKRSLTEEEKTDWHLSVLHLLADEAFEEYQKCSSTPLGKLIKAREVPVFEQALQYLKKHPELISLPEEALIANL